jgi:hypothetical protein
VWLSNLKIVLILYTFYKRRATMTVIHPKPFNQSPVVLLLNASELIQDMLDGPITADDGDNWIDRAVSWKRDYGAYINREHGDDNV